MDFNQDNLRNNSYLLQAITGDLPTILQGNYTVWPSEKLLKTESKNYAVEICTPCRNNCGAKWPLLSVVSLWPLISLESPKQRTGVARFYCPSMRKGDSAALAWWMGSNWESKAGIKELYPAIKLCCSHRSRTRNLLCLGVYVCVCVCGGGCVCLDSCVITVIHTCETGCNNLIETNTVLESSGCDHLV